MFTMPLFSDSRPLLTDVVVSMVTWHNALSITLTLWSPTAPRAIYEPSLISALI